VEEWNQQRADRRSLETMRRIALDAMEFKDDDGAFYTYADEHGLTVNEVAFYLNAYEYGGDAGLQVIRNKTFLHFSASKHKKPPALDTGGSFYRSLRRSREARACSGRG
jgi:hypothetical protein